MSLTWNQQEWRGDLLGKLCTVTTTQCDIGLALMPRTNTIRVSRRSPLNSSQSPELLLVPVSTAHSPTAGAIQLALKDLNHHL